MCSASIERELQWGYLAIKWETMLTYRDFKAAFKELDLGLHSRIIVHANLQAFEPVAGGANSIAGALLAAVEMCL